MPDPPVGMGMPFLFSVKFMKKQLYLIVTHKTKKQFRFRQISGGINMDNNTQKPNVGLVLFGAALLGIRLGLNLQNWLTRRKEDYEVKKRENRRLLRALPVKKVNAVLKVMKAEEDLHDAKWRYEDCEHRLAKVKEEAAKDQQ